MTIQMKELLSSAEKYLTVMLFIMLCKVVLTASLWMKCTSADVQMIAGCEQYFPVVLFIIQVCG